MMQLVDDINKAFGVSYSTLQDAAVQNLCDVSIPLTPMSVISDNLPFYMRYKWMV